MARADGEPPGPAQVPAARRRRRAVGPAGAPTAPDQAATGWAAEPADFEDDDERLLREVPPHHGG